MYRIKILASPHPRGKPSTRAPDELFMASTQFCEGVPFSFPSSLSFSPSLLFSLAFSPPVGVYQFLSVILLKVSQSAALRRQKRRGGARARGRVYVARCRRFHERVIMGFFNQFVHSPRLLFGRGDAPRGECMYEFQTAPPCIYFLSIFHPFVVGSVSRRREGERGGRERDGFFIKPFFTTMGDPRSVL